MSSITSFQELIDGIKLVDGKKISHINFLMIKCNVLCISMDLFLQQTSAGARLT